VTIVAGVRRALSILFCVSIAAFACVLAANVLANDGLSWLDLFRISLLAISVAWLAYGATIALNGLLTLKDARRPETPVGQIASRTAVLVPVYNEEPAATFSRVAAMMRSLALTGHGHLFDFAILSDTTNDAVGAQEAVWFERLLTETGDLPSAVYYRRRTANVGRKAGNIGDFVRTSGAAYEYMLILDADSLMHGETMLTMVQRMEAEPRLGLLQTLPKIIKARSWFGRCVQFAASYYSPVFARGVAETQGREGPFWGHNAITRTRAFAQSCGLPSLSGPPPFGGHILSHDYVEAALLAREGWIVRLDPDLEGSFEEGPENVIDYAKRDRRWCQGNLQHGRLIAAPGLKPWSRLVFVQGIMAYVASPIWALFLMAALLAPLFALEPNYFPQPSLPPVFPQVARVEALTLLTGVVGILIGPKILIFLRNMATGRNRAFGGNLAAFGGMVAEILWSSVVAPLMLMYQSRSVMQVLFGADGGWPASNREADAVGLREAFEASWWIILVGAAVLYFSAEVAPDLFYWLLPVSIPMIAAPFLISWSSRPAGSAKRAYRGLFATLQDREQDPLVEEQRRTLARWRAQWPAPGEVPAAGVGPGPITAAIPAE
jgi:membrane glycosyltransferase